MTTLYLTLRRTDDSESDSAGGNTGSNDTSLQEVDYSVLKGIQLQVPCNTWTWEHAKANFGVDCLEEQTEVEVAKVRTSLAKVPMFTIRFPKFKSTFNGYEVSYSNKYAVEISDALQSQHGAYVSSAKWMQTESLTSWEKHIYQKPNLFQR